MPFVAELYFDPSTEERIRKAWQALDEVGISDSMPKGGYRPHISLGICNHLELDAFVQELSAFAADIMPFRLPFPNIGIFSTSEGVVYWGQRQPSNCLIYTRNFMKSSESMRRSNGNITLLDNGCRTAPLLSVCQSIRLLKP